MSNLMRGTILLSGAIFISKFLGLIFFIPLNAIVGIKGIALYQYAYTPYTIILSLATLGIPMAVSKFVSKYNALGDYHTGRRLLKSGFVLMIVTGIIAFLLLFLLAPAITPFIVGDGALKGNQPSDVTTVIRLISISLIVVPIMSLMRGFFQGHQSMGPTAASQVIEQLLRVLFALSATTIVIVMFGKQFTTTAVGFATFAPFVGAIGGITVLIWYWFKRKGHLNKQLEQSPVNSDLSLKSIYKELITFAFPFVVIGLAIPLYQFVDQLTITRTLMAQGLEKFQSEKIYANISGLSQKLIMIPVALSTAVSQTLIPAITDSFSSEKYQLMKNQITQAFQTILFLTIPAAVGLSTLAYPIYGSLFGMEDIQLGGEILKWYAPTALLFASFMISSSVLQGINRQKFAVFSLIVGLLFKILLNKWLLSEFHEIGAILATNIGFICSIALNLIIIRIYTRYQFTFILKRLIWIIFISILMAVVVRGVMLPFKGSQPIPESWLQALIMMIIGVVVGGVFYFILSTRIGLTKHILGNRFPLLKRRRKRENS